jgi:mRNA-degrading endonuclease RelE of RelBE toxin-antitoxin system
LKYNYEIIRRLERELEKLRRKNIKIFEKILKKESSISYAVGMIDIDLDDGIAVNYKRRMDRRLNQDYRNGAHAA